MIRFRLPNGSTCAVEPIYLEMNFLAHAQIEERDIGSRCGGHGQCGGDRIRFRSEDLSRITPPTHEEREHLTAEELRDGIRLACQVRPLDQNQYEVEVLGQ